MLDKVKAEKTPFAKNLSITLRHDGAKAHTGQGNEAAVNVSGSRDRWEVTIKRQSGQSSDMNKNDLCFFSCLQKAADRIKKKQKDIPSLTEAVYQAYEEYPEDILVYVHALQFKIYRQVLTDSGGNSYNLPHSGIRKRQRGGEPIAGLTVPYDLYQSMLGTAAAYSELSDIV